MKVVDRYPAAGSASLAEAGHPVKVVDGCPAAGSASLAEAGHPVKVADGCPAAEPCPRLAGEQTAGAVDDSLSPGSAARGERAGR